MSENLEHLSKIAAELRLSLPQIRAVGTLISEGATVPFMARYRKEATGSLDEVQITSIRDRLEQLAELDQRRQSVIKSLEERGLITEGLKREINAAEKLSTLEDLYLPFRPKKRTRAAAAKEKGLEPLADYLFNHQSVPLALAESEAAKYLVQSEGKEKAVASTTIALAGARDILAERMSDDQVARQQVRGLFERQGILKSKVVPGKEVEGAKFQDYFEWSEPAAKAPSHRILAIRRGESEGCLILRIHPPEEAVLPLLESIFVKGNTSCGEQVKLALHDCYKRLLGPAMETEASTSLKRRADEEAIRVFAENLRELLLAAPLGRKNVLAIDPGFRTGCKIVCLDRQGKLLTHDVIYPAQGDHKNEEAAARVLTYCQQYQVEAIAIGNGTAGRETETFIRGLGLPASIAVVMVNESGASIYSASEAAREEFPNHDLTVRGAVSIGRRLMDPLAELVKIDPKSIGVGQYQHDVEPQALKRSLDDVVVTCVNNVGVELNTASVQLLSYVSGLNSQIANNIVAHRNKHGAFTNRKELLTVSRLGPKAFEQAAGFLRIRESAHPLDASAVHPESYGIVDKMAADLGCTISDLVRNETLRKKIVLKQYVTEKVGLPTLSDILAELAKPGRDPRHQFQLFSFASGVEKIGDLTVGMKLPGLVTNVTAFGAFVDIGVHQDGLVHISQMSDQFVKNPADIVKVQQKVQVTVLEIDVPRKRIALSMKSQPDPSRGDPERARSASPKPRPEERGKTRNQTSKPSSFGGDWFNQAINKK